MSQPWRNRRAPAAAAAATPLLRAAQAAAAPRARVYPSFASEYPPAREREQGPAARK